MSEFYAAVPQSHFFGLKASKLLKTAGTRVGMPPVGNVVHASTATAQETALEWAKKDKRRMLHVVYRVGDLDRTIKYVFSKYIVVIYPSLVSLADCSIGFFCCCCKQSCGWNLWTKLEIIMVADSTPSAWEWNCWGNETYQRRDTPMLFLDTGQKILTLLLN